jgi:hypothetical protein
VRFAIFTDQLGPVTAEADRLTEKLFDTLPSLSILPRQLLLCQASQELAARSVLGFDLRVNSRQELVGH